MELNACGYMCSECPFFGNQCEGCNVVEGKPFWAVEHYPNKVCPIYDCSVNTKHHKNCGECDKLPCKIFTDLRDPSMSDEEYESSLKTRIDRLKKQ